MFRFCRLVKKWVIALLVWIQLYLPLAHAFPPSLWVEVERDEISQLLFLNISYADVNPDIPFDQRVPERLERYGLTFEDRDPYLNHLNHNVLFQGQSTRDACSVHLTQGSETAVNFIIYQDGRVIVKDLVGASSDFEIKTCGDLTLDLDHARSVHGLNLTGRNITQQSQLQVTHSFNAATPREGEGTGQFINEPQGKLFLQSTSDFTYSPQDFKPDFYLSINPGITEEALRLGQDPLVYAKWHYLNYGYKHGFSDLPADFSSQAYNILNPGVAQEAFQQGKDPLQYATWHYLNYGRLQGLSYRPHQFDAGIYLQLYPELRQDALRHQIEATRYARDHYNCYGHPTLSLNEKITPLHNLHRYIHTYLSVPDLQSFKTILQTPKSPGGSLEAV